jgi:hypothetical protein
MAVTPKFVLRDGSGTSTQLVYTTNKDYTTLEGVIDQTAVDVQVSVNGAAFVSDPTLVQIDLLTFVIPNPTSNPDGLSLEPGENTIAVRVVDIIGGVSAPATATITRISTYANSITYIPTGVKVQRRRDSVDILTAKPIVAAMASSGFYTPQPEFRGFNIYASASAAGATGYFRVNENLVTTPTTLEEDTSNVASTSVRWSGTQSLVRVRISEEDEFGQEVQALLDERMDATTYMGDLKFSGSLDGFNQTTYVKFNHPRAGGSGVINTDQFSDVPSSEPLYYVVTGVYWDPATQTEFETPYSQEVLGAPLVIDTAIKDLPSRTQLQIVTDYIAAIQRVNTEISLIPGSTSRDVSIDPFASEAERLWFIVDFVHRCASFLTLLQIDDANGDGISDPVASSAYKQAIKAALGLTTDTAVQSLIDTQFEKLAANCDKTRLPGRPASGQAVVYTTTKPTKDIPIPAGTIVTSDADTTNNIPAIRYRVGGTYTLRYANVDSYYNFDKKRWEITVDITAESTGSNGNRPANSIKTISGVSGVQVTNTEATQYGTDQESNGDLAARSILGYVSVDSGTEGGYQATAVGQVGIVKSKIVKSGDDLMMRDWDDVRKKHIGGKVDIWIQGLREQQVTDTFAFTFEIARDIRCQIVDLSTLTFRALDSRVTVDTPIVEILNNPSMGLGVRNVTAGADYDLTGVTILDYRTFKLNTVIAQPTTHIDDIITADYRFQSVNTFTFTLQPVRRIVSVVGEVSGTLTPDTHYKLYKTDDPLLEGESALATDHMVITQVGGIPSGDTITINDEVHTLIGYVQEPLGSIGINTSTIRIFNAERTVEFDGPEAAIPDFDIISGTATTPAKIVRTSASAILNGQAVSVDYTHDENFTVTYVVNDLIQELQRKVNSGPKHITGDVLVKQSVQNSIVLETSVQMTTGAKKDKVDPAIRSNVSLELNKRQIGQGAAQSDVINSVDSTEGVDYQIVPLALMAYADGSRKLREEILSTYTSLPSLYAGGVRAYILTNAMQNPTTNGGGYVTEHRGVFQDDVAMTLVDTLANVATAAGQAYIIGADGVIITGYSDDATLIAAGFTTAAAILAERLRRTANHVIVALSAASSPADVPTDHAYTVSYVIRGDSGAHDFYASAVEFLDLGSLTVTYRNG